MLFLASSFGSAGKVVCGQAGGSRGCPFWSASDGCRSPKLACLCHSPHFFGLDAGGTDGDVCPRRPYARPSPAGPSVRGLGRGGFFSHPCLGRTTANAEGFMARRCPPSGGAGGVCGDAETLSAFFRRFLTGCHGGTAGKTCRRAAISAISRSFRRSAQSVVGVGFGIAIFTAA